MADFYFYSERVISSGVTLANFASVKLDDERTFVIYGGSNDSGKYSVLTHGNNFLDVTPPQSLADSVRNVSACKIAEDKIAVTYRDNATNAPLVAQIFTFDGTDITVGTKQNINASNNGNFVTDICEVDTNKFCVIYTLGGSVSNVTRLVVGSVSGTTITFGSEEDIAADDYGNLSIGKLTTDKIVYFYDNGTNLVAEARTISGETLSAAGASVNLAAGSSSFGTSTKSKFIEYATDSVLVAYPVYSSSARYPYLANITASGTTLTVSGSKQINTDSTFDMAFIDIGNNDYMFMFHNADEINGEYALVKFNGTTFSVGEFKQYQDGAPEVFLASLSDGNASLLYYNGTDSDLYIALVTREPIRAVDKKRNISASQLVSWKKDFRSDIILFTIGVSSIGGNDLIAPSEQIDSQWNKYLYFDESQYLNSLEYEHGLQLPIGGIRVGLAEGEFDNTSGRFTPRYMGGSSELFTSILPRRPFILNAGFEDQGVKFTHPQFVGLFDRQPEVNLRNKYLRWTGKDFVDFLTNRYVDDEAMFTGLRSDQLIEQILQDLGFGTAQYDLDQGLNTIPFTIFKRGDRFGDIIDRLSKAEYANFYQDEQGVLKFENRHHWNSSPHNEVQWEFFTSQVLEAELPSDDHIINVVEVKADVRQKQPAQTIFTLNTFDSIQVNGNSTEEVFVDFEDPVLAITTPTNGGTLSFYKANTQPDGSGSDATSSLTITKQYLFSNAAKFTFSNSSASTVYLTELVVNGRPAKVEKSIYYRTQDDSSVTAYEERPYVIENDYIQTEDWASTLSQLLLIDFGTPENLQTLTIRAIPQLKLGDLVSWQGRHWRVYEKSSILNSSSGFIQEVKLLQRTIQTFFRIGVSLVGSSDKIAP